MKTTKLTPSDLLEFSSIISLNPNYEGCWQSVYFSQLYGTSFGLYAKIIFNKKERTIDKISLRLINYKGVINLGIKSATYNSKRKRIRVEENYSKVDNKYINVISIKLVIQGLNKTTKVNDIIIDFKLPEGTENHYLEIDRSLCSMTEKKDEDITDSNVFDSEFYYRDGLRTSDPISRDYRDAIGVNPTVNSKNKVIDEKGNEIDENSTTDKGSGGICPKGYSLIVF